VEIAVENGRITSLVWDAEREDGTRLSESDESGPVPVDSLPWGEQTALTAAYLMELQDPTVVQTREDGTTEEIEGVVIPVKSCLDLMRACMVEAGMVPVPAPTPPPPDLSGLIDSVSGATITSRAVVKAANLAVEYITRVESDASATGS
jgi:major membrane immunogen (membrane-anchored lipoprotein)